MHLRNVEIFCDVVTHGSFSKAAAENQVSQSAASQAVGMLEKRLGCRLIDRSKRPLELTAAGQIYYDGCRKILESFRHVEDRVQQMRNKVIGRVRLAAIYSVGLLQMDTYAKRYKTQFPDVVLQLEYLHPDEVYSRVLNDESDLGIVSFPRAGNEIASIAWQNQEMVLAVPRGHRHAGRPSIAVSQLDGESFVGFTSELTIRKQIDRWFKQAGISVEFVHLFDNVENIKRAVEIGSGVALLPAPTVRREAENGSLFAVPIEGTPWHRPLGIIHRRNRTLTNPARKLVELLRESPELIASRGSEKA
jgi:LysR family transcriptional regulator, low CO2-responsive transcriptional regulator